MVKKNEKIKCKGYLASFQVGNFEIKACLKNAVDVENMLCNSHQYMSDFTDTQFDEIKNDEWVVCKRCRHFLNKATDKKFIPRCDDCLNEGKQYNKKKKEELVKDKCQWFDRNMDRCRVKGLDNGYCKFHQYVVDYSEDEKKESKKCNGCNKVKYLSGFVSCDVCRNRGKKNRDVKKEKKVYCKSKDCKYEEGENGYCGKHDREYIVKQINQDETRKICRNFMHRYKCRSILDVDYAFSTCENCREKYREEDKKKREMIKLENRDRLKNKKDLKCIKCKKEFIKEFFTNKKGKIGDKCQDCLKNQYEYDNLRLSKSERQGIKNNISEIRNRAKTSNREINLTDTEIINLICNPCVYCGVLTHPENLKANNGIDRVDNNKGYIRGNVVSACWDCNRMKHALELKKFYKCCSNIIKYFGSTNLIGDKRIGHRNLSQVKYDAEVKRHIDFDLTKEEYLEIVKYKCYYCDSTNYHTVGPDRIDSNIGYRKDNLVSACWTCNRMKGRFSVVDFKSHVQKILNYKEQNIKIIRDINKIPKEISTEWIISKINDFILSSKKEIRRNQIQNHIGVKKFSNENKYYISKIYNTYDISSFEPELEFCETKEQKELWMFYRLKVSSCPYNKSKGRNLKILVRDKKTKKYVGITSLSSDIFNCECRDDYIGWDNERKQENLQKIMNITTCVAIPPFSYNFNGGKLLAMLMFSNEVFDYIKKRYGHKIYGLTTFSLYGKSIQYDRLKEIKLIGYTKGYGTVQFPTNLYHVCLKYMDQKGYNYKKYNSRMHKISFLMGKLNMNRELLRHNQVRGVFIGYYGKDSPLYLRGEKKDNFNPDLLKSVDVIGKYWKDRWGKQRFNHLLNENRLLINVSFDNNIISQKDKQRVLTQKSRNKNRKENYNRLTEVEINKIIKYHVNNRNKTYNFIANKFAKEFDKKINNKQIKNLLNFN